MARLEKQNNRFLISLTDEEAKGLGLENVEFELFSPKKGLLVLTEKTSEAVAKANLAENQSVQKNDSALASPMGFAVEIDEKLFKILSDRKQLSTRIEGKFEKTLSKTELERFNELRKEGLIEKFKLNEQYKQAVYRLNEKKLQEKKSSPATIPKNASMQPSSWNTSANSKPTANSNSVNSGTPSLERDGFLVLKTENDARMLSNQRADEFKKGELRGIKTFDGSFFVIKKTAFENAQTKILRVFEQTKTIDLKNLEQQTHLRLELLQGACEFLKEDGFLFEKTKQTYCLV